MSYGVSIEVWGDRALFSRPELKVERMSYDCITPSAARGILESIYWHPGMRYRIDAITILSKIDFRTVRTNEINCKASAKKLYDAIVKSGDLPNIDISNHEIRTQRSITHLVNVRYIIDAHFELVHSRMGEEDCEGKYASILKRRLAKGQCYQQPYLGISEFPANVRLRDEVETRCGHYSSTEIKDLGLMLYDMDYSNARAITPMFFRAVMHHGVIDVAGSEVLR